MFSKRGRPRSTAERESNRGRTMLTITTLTQDIHSPDFLQSIINPKAGYQLIPACPQTLAYNPETLLQTAMKASVYIFPYSEEESSMWPCLTKRPLSENFRSITWGGTSSSMANWRGFGWLLQNNTNIRTTPVQTWCDGQKDCYNKCQSLLNSALKAWNPPRAPKLSWFLWEILS